MRFKPPAPKGEPFPNMPSAFEKVAKEVLTIFF
jgi:hypothetical protein